MLRIVPVNLDLQLPEKPIKKWRGKFEAQNLGPLDFVQYFQAASPHFFNIDQNADFSELGRCIYDEQGAKVAILDVIEEFICGENPQTMLEKLKTEDNIPSVCGRVFKMGEPTYSCRECGMDQTCVLCVNCFKQSAHKNHKYKMSTSSGGGCCDCGDEEAWKRDPYCDEHILGTEVHEESSLITEKMKECCRLVFQGIMNYCIKSLEIESNASNACLDGDDNIFCTVLYNDETHTFEQVIQTLTRVVGCQQKDAVEYVTSIDREGRAVVKCTTFEACAKLREDIEKQGMRQSNLQRSLPLRVGVLHRKAIAYQQFALQLLAWFQDFLTRHIMFRKIFCEVATSTPNFNIQHILSNDCKLWKTARTSWHRLLISGMLMEYDNKKSLAILFTKIYTNIMQDFIHDDHEHSFSVVSLGVQLFTVPTIAHHLIAHESAFFKLMHTFYSECIEKYVQKKVLQFAKNTANMNLFKRASFILFDLKYLLSFKPDVWTDSLRTGFLHGVQILMRLLKVMQGMDAVHRQTGQHMEYEPEWESAFNLHIKLAHIISLVIDWCSTDRVVLIKVYRMVHADLSESEFIISQAVNEVKELADHSASCYMYDVASNQCSIHLPLSRFFAGLYLHLEKFGLTFDTITAKATKPSPEQIIEPVLCTQTMIAQVHSGMWRRNGYSLLNQLYFYRNVKCRTEMLDRDIIVLQIGASLIESNEFLIHLMNKFNLINWAAPDYETESLKYPEEDSIRHVINMVDEFLELLIVIIGERYVPGIGCLDEEEKIKKEIIQQLCIKPFSHSELNRTLPESQHETRIENVIENVAVFKKPTQSDKKGYYELKPEYYNDYNMYFYHYTKEEKSKSEEAQRKRRKANGELVCCPPPSLPKLTETFSMIANLLQCDVMLLLMQTVLKRAIDLKARIFSESHLQKALHIIGYALQEEESNNYPFLTFQERATEWDLLPLMEELQSSARVEAHRDLIIWTIKKFKERIPVDSTVKMESEDEQPADESAAAAAEQAEKEERAKLAATRRAEILSQMANAQKQFMSSNAELFENAGSSCAESNAIDMDWQIEELNETTEKIACIGPNRKAHNAIEEKFTCILCSEDSVVSKDGSCLVYSAFIQKSSVLSRFQKVNDLGQLQYLETSIHPYPHTSTCGHVMHAQCWTEYFNNEVAKENRRPYRNRSPGSFDIDKKEFLCPLCRCISNCVIPLTPELSSFGSIAGNDEEIVDFNTWMTIMEDYSESLQTVDSLMSGTDDDLESIYPSLETVLSKYSVKIENFYKISQPQNEVIGAKLNEHIQSFTEFAKTVAPLSSAPEQIDSLLVTWCSCSYSIESLEMLLRVLGKPLKGQLSIRHSCCLSGLIRLCGLTNVAQQKKKTVACCGLTNVAQQKIDRNLILHMRDIYNRIFGKSDKCILEWDIFYMLTTLIFITPSAIYAYDEQYSIPKGEYLEFYILKLLFLANIARTVITFDDRDTNEIGTMETDDHDDGQSELIKFYRSYNIYRDDDESKMTKRSLIDSIKKQNETFLRCSCLLFHFLTDVEMPDDFANLNGDTFDLMCEYLGLDTEIETYFNTESLNKFMTQMATHSNINLIKTGKVIEGEEVMRVMTTVAPIRQLVSLPSDYSDLMNSVSLFTCPNNDRDDSRNPTMCLVCGEVLCSQTYCCQKDLNKSMVGACTYHAHTCGAGVGMFLRIRECEILLLSLNKGCFVSPPYLDEYGETDQGLRRGNPLRLCKERYRKLHLMWLGHGLHEEIARSTESTSTMLPTQWHHL